MKNSERTDSERLDWLTKSGATIAHSKDGDCCWLHWPYGKEFESTESEAQKGAFATAREAIDAEMDRMAKPVPLGKQKGILLNGFDGAFTFRVYHSPGVFTDYRILHSDMSIEIDDKDVFVYEDEAGNKYIDHSPKTLGRKEE